MSEKTVHIINEFIHNFVIHILQKFSDDNSENPGNVESFPEDFHRGMTSIPDDS